MINHLQNIISSNYGLDIALELFGENERNNVYCGSNLTESFIIKIEDISQMKQVKLAVEISNLFLKSDIIASSRFIKSLNGNYFVLDNDKIITVQVKESVKIIDSLEERIFNAGKSIGEFHKILLNSGIETDDNSDFYKDFMNNEIHLAQNQERLDKINRFFEDNMPKYSELSKGIIHNDLNSNNLLELGEKFFIIDFEHLKNGPLISDLGVFILDFWDKDKGISDYKSKLSALVKGYEESLPLSDYDKEKIILFSIRYLISDENWYTYWNKKTENTDRTLIIDAKEKQLILLNELEFK